MLSLAVQGVLANDYNGSWNIDPETSAGWLTYANYHFQPNWFAEVSYSNQGEASATDKNTIRNLHGNISYNVSVAYIFDGSKKSSVKSAAAREAMQARPAVSDAGCQLFEGSLENIHYNNGSVDLSATFDQNSLNSPEILAENTTLTIQARAETDWDGSEDLPTRLCQKIQYQR